MARTRLAADVRQRALLEATVRSLVARGPGGTSIRSVAEEAGVSPGLLRYHFGAKGPLLAAAYRLLSAELQEAGEQALAGAGVDPAARLRAFLGAGFTPPILDDGRVAARLVFWELARTEPEVAAVHAEIYGRYRSELAALIDELVPARDATEREHLVFALSALLDGLWLERSVGQRDYDPQAMVETCFRLVDAFLRQTGA